MPEGKEDHSEKIAKGATLGAGKGPGTYLQRKREKKIKRKTVQPTSILPILEKRAMDEEMIPRIVSFLEQHGVLIRSYKEKYIARRLRVRMNRLNLNSYAHYLSYLKTHPYEIAALKQSFSINVTRFFRNRDTFELIRDFIVPKITQQSKNIGRHLKIWSAGCAVGAEPYTIAMIFDEEVQRHNIRMEIIATDINEELLEIGRHGIYDPSYLAEMTKAEAVKFFDLRNDGNYEVKPRIKSYVRFMKHDLIKDDYIKGVDVIFCRNVLIYIDKNAQREIIDKFVDSLNPGGYLAIGRTETLFGHWRNKLETISGVHRIYQKKTPSYHTEQMIVPRKRSQSLRLQAHKKKHIEIEGFKERFQERKRIWEEKIKEIEERRAKIKRIQQNKEEKQSTPLVRNELRSVAVIRKKWERNPKKEKKSTFVEKNETMDWRRKLEERRKQRKSLQLYSFKERIRSSKEKNKKKTNLR